MEQKKLIHGSLFSGIGGFDYAAEQVGWTNAFHCEWDAFNQKILKYHFPNSVSYGDITKTDFSIWRGRIDIISGGFPCQPFSLAGKRKGTEDERHLWPEMLRAISEIQPTWVVGENVFGLVNWDGGLVFEQVQADLEAQGYEVQPFILPACAVNAPHRRDRVWFVAYTCNRRPHGSENGQGNRQGDDHNTTWEDTAVKFEGCSSKTTRNNWTSKNTYCDGRGGFERKEEPNQWEQRNTCTRDNEWLQANDAETWNAPNTESQSSERMRFEQRKNCGQEQRQFGGDCGRLGSQQNATDTQCSRGGKILQDIQREQPNGEQPYPFDEQNYWSEFPTQSPVCNGDDGLSSRLDGITFSKWRANSIKAGGNAIVPQVAMQIFKAINEFNSQWNSK